MRVSKEAMELLQILRRLELPVSALDLAAESNRQRSSVLRSMARMHGHGLVSSEIRKTLLSKSVGGARHPSVFGLMHHCLTDRGRAVISTPSPIAPPPVKRIANSVFDFAQNF